MHRIRPRPPPNTFFHPHPRPHPHFRTYQNSPFNHRPKYQRFSPRSTITSSLYSWAARPTFYRDVGLLTTGAATIYILNLETVPVSGRRRFNFIPPSLEASLGAATVSDIKQQYAGRFLDESDPRVRMVRRVLDRLLPFALKEGEGEGLDQLNWEVFVIESAEQNAFVVPGGKVFFFTGLLGVCGGEEGVAAVLGHEVAHVVARHTAERMSRAPLLLLPILASLLLDISFTSANLILQIFLSMPASRKHEAEADYIGLLMAAQACYRPEAAMEFWARMEKSAGHGPPQILSTHPSHHDRVGLIRDWLPKAREVAEQSECAGTGRYFDEFRGAMGGLGGPWR